MRVAITLLTCGLAGCAGAPYSKEPWPTIFAEDLRHIAGESFADCGFHDLLNRKPSRAERRDVLACLEGARRAGKSSRFGTFRLPIDSYAWEVYLRTTNGDAWMLVVDQMVDEESAQYWVLKCREVEVDRATLVLRREDCVQLADRPGMYR